MPNVLIEQVKQLNIRISKQAVTPITRHIHHLQNRESIRIDLLSIERRIRKYSRKKSGSSQFVASCLQGIKNGLVSNSLGHWHRPTVSPFHTKTGRDNPLGASLNQIPKVYWPKVLLPPKSSVYVLLDYQQQEPMITAYMAGCQKLIDWYKEGDIYERLAQEIGCDLTREQCKKLLIGHLYGIGFNSTAETLKVTIEQVKDWLDRLTNITQPIGPYLNRLAAEIQRNHVAYSLDWRHAVSDTDSRLSLRNWQIQATGADIMRRACINLDKSNIPLLLTNHDSFLVRLDQQNYPDQLSLAIQALTGAAVDVLGGFKLTVKVEMQLPSSI